MRVLIVEDDRLVRRAMERFLPGLGCETVSAESVSAALSILHRLDEIDCVLCDLALPDGSGLDVARGAPERLRKRFVFFTGEHPESALYQEALTLGPVRQKGDPVAEVVATLRARVNGDA